MAFFGNVTLGNRSEVCGASETRTDATLRAITELVPTAGCEGRCSDLTLSSQVWEDRAATHCIPALPFKDSKLASDELTPKGVPLFSIWHQRGPWAEQEGLPGAGAVSFHHHEAACPSNVQPEMWARGTDARQRGTQQTYKACTCAGNTAALS